MNPTSNYLTCAGREVHFMEWGAGHADTVIAWHGLARTGRDMDELAACLSAPKNGYRVICPDTVGRGLSEWSPDPKNEYCLGFYTQLATALVDHLDLKQFDWVGTSMGGAIGMAAAAGLLRGRIRRLVLNDIGPEAPATEARRIADYMSKPPTFNTVRDVEHFMRTQYFAMGEMTDEQWLWRAETSVRRLPDGRFTLHYDPRIAAELVNRPADFSLWEVWDRIACPVLVLHGISSKVLTAETAQRMSQRGPKARIEVLQGCGHPPALNTPQRVALIQDFISG